MIELKFIRFASSFGLKLKPSPDDAHIGLGVH
jgi:hypothetical protein